MPTLNIFIRIVLTWIALSANTFLFGISDIYFRRITINEGLSLSSVYCVYQDSRGFMWFGTEDGLNKYDGKNFTIYNHHPLDSNSLSYKWIESIAEDRHGNLWIGSRNGVTRLSPANDQIVRYRTTCHENYTLSNDTVVSLAIYDNYVWVGTMNGVNRISTETLKAEFIDLHCNNQDNKVFAFHSDHRNRIWIGTQCGLFVGYPGENKVIAYNSSLQNNGSTAVHSICSLADTLWVGGQNSVIKYMLKDEIKAECSDPPIQLATGADVESIYKDSKSNIWVITRQSLYKIDANQLTPIIETPHSSPSLAIHPRKPLLEDAEGNIWLGTFGNGVYRITTNPESILHLLHNPANSTSLSDNTVNCIYEDRAGGLWFGTFGAGISLYNPTSNIIRTLQHNAFDDSSMSSSFVWSIQESAEGNVWIGTNTTGINIYNPKNNTFQHITHQPDKPGSLPDGAVREIFRSSNGTYWIGTDGGGLSKYNADTHSFRHFQCDADDPSTISSNSVRTIYEDSTGILWIGTRNGLNRFDPATEVFTRYMHNPLNGSSISHNFVYSAIYMDKSGYLWVGTYGGGLNRMNPQTGEFIRYRFDPENTASLSDDIVFSIYQDEKGYFWIGTNSGLNLFNPSTGKFKRYGTESGLPNEVIYGIMPDNNNRLWLTTNKGVSRLDLTEFRFKNFDVRDGLQSNEFNGGAFHRGESGLIYAGGVYGLSIIDPEKIVPVANSAELIISRLEIMGKDVKVIRNGMNLNKENKKDMLIELIEDYYLPKHITYMKEVRLNYKQRFFSIEFAALNHHIPEKLTYRYRMQNLEEHWNNAGNRNYVTYANMKPGSYIFEVDARNSDGNLTSSPAQLKIVITPPFWLTYWFMLILAIILLLIIVFIYRYLLNQRTNALLKEQYEQIKLAHSQLKISESNLKELNATKDKFFSIISHDLKNPFASVLSISELMEDNFDSTHPDELRYGVSKIHKTNKHIFELLENLLTWSKSQRGNITVDKVDFNLSKIIETIINILKLATEKKKITVVNNCVENLHATADREMISTVFRNLLNNALKFTPSGKKITIDSLWEENSVTISITDEGTGIAEENLKRLFKIDDKFKTDGTDGEKGTGLGLIICKEFIEKNDGKIDVSSTPGLGSKFSFTIPAGSDSFFLPLHKS